MVAAPASIVHTPVPGAAALAASVKVDVLQSVWSAPAAATGGVWLLVSTTSSKLVQAPLLIVHLNVTLFPVIRPVTVLVGDVSVVILAPLAAPVIVHKPVAVTGEGASAAKVKFGVLHSSWSAPALAATGGALFVSTTTSDVEHEPLLIVHLSVTLLPAARPVTVVVGEAVLVMVAAPASIVHTPVPGAAALAASVKVDVLQSVWSAPAAATGGVWLLVSTTSSKLVQAPLVTVHLNVTLFPAIRPVTVLVGDVSVVILAPLAAPVIVHKPVAVTGEGASAAKVKFGVLHSSWSAPALAATGGALFVSTTTSDVEHEPLLIVHLSVTLLPAARPVTVLVGEAVLVMVAAPASIVHTPVPGADRKSTRLNSSHLVISY